MNVISRRFDSQAVFGEGFPSFPRDPGHSLIEYIGDGISLGALGTLRFGSEQQVEIDTYRENNIR